MEEEKGAGRGVVCYCFGRTGDEIRALAAREGWRTAAEVSLHFLAGAGCALCRPEIEAILASLAAGGSMSRAPGAPGDPPGRAGSG
jgi:NAD(P)H-nitrite reductase large subunit